MKQPQFPVAASSAGGRRAPALALKHACLVLLACASADRARAFSAPSPPPPVPPNEKYRIAIIGGGSSGMFAAASIIETLNSASSSSSASLESIDVKVYESTHEALRTIRDAHRGGILHDGSSKTPRELLAEGYPRGRKEITSLLTKEFPPAKQRTWFEDRGVEFRTERDGSVVECATTDNRGGNRVCDAILSKGVFGLVGTGEKVTSIVRENDDGTGGFRLTIQDGAVERCDIAILATGNSNLGHRLASSLNHTITNPVRSCFSFRLNSTAHFAHLQEEGVHRYHLLPLVRLSYKVKVKGRKRPRVHKSLGPASLEIHDDAIILAGAAALSLSSTAAHDLRDAGCAGSLLVHFCPEHLGGNVEMLEKDLWRHRQENPREVVGDRCPLIHRQVDYDEYDWETESFRAITNECIPAELWRSMARACGAPNGATWSKMSPKKTRRLAEMAVGCPLEFDGRITASGDPFVNAGGVLLKEVDMSTMESKVAENLFCCGQVLDGDGSRAGFSMMRGFATGKVAGESAALRALERIARLNNKAERAVS